MSNSETPEVGTIGWTDLTIENAEEIRDFYQQVVGWQSEGLSMGEYDDFVMKAPGSGKGVAGVCHARGGNSGLPAQWLVYIIVADLDQSIARCVELGGKVIAGPKALGGSRYCVIQDPAGAVAALYQAG